MTSAVSKATRLACSRCGEEIAAPYQKGRCYDEQSEPAEMDMHDEAEPWETVHGAPKKLRDPLEYNRDTDARFDRVRYDPASYEPLKPGEHPVRLRVLFDAEDSLTYVGEEKATSERKTAEALSGGDNGAWLTSDDVRWLHRQLGALVLKWDGEKTTAGLRECIGAYGKRGDLILFTEEAIGMQVFANETAVLDEVTRRSGIAFPAQNDEEQAERDKHGHELWKSDDAMWKKLRARAEWRAAGLFTKSRAQFDKWRMAELEAAAKESSEPTEAAP